jgi:hypothetical protein
MKLILLRTVLRRRQCGRRKGRSAQAARARAPNSRTCPRLLCAAPASACFSLRKRAYRFAQPADDAVLLGGHDLARLLGGFEQDVARPAALSSPCLSPARSRLSHSRAGFAASIASAVSSPDGDDGHVAALSVSCSPRPILNARSVRFAHGRPASRACANLQIHRAPCIHRPLSRRLCASMSSAGQMTVMPGIERMSAKSSQHWCVAPSSPTETPGVGRAYFHIEVRVAYGIAHLLEGAPRGEHRERARERHEPHRAHAGGRRHHVAFGYAAVKMPFRKSLAENPGLGRRGEVRVEHHDIVIVLAPELDVSALP